MSETSHQGVWAVFVTWNPDPDRFALAVTALAGQVDGVVVVDNGSANVELVRSCVAEYPRATLIALGENRGVGAALNVGVRDALRHAPEWIVTMDQDTLVPAGAIAGIRRDLDALDPDVGRRSGIVALRSHPQPSSIWLTRYGERLMTLGACGRFLERRGVITSGSLVRAEVAAAIEFDESMFIDQVDFDFCARVRQRGFVVLLQREFTTDHVLGRHYEDAGRIHPYENAQRFYYVVRNSTYLVLRRRLLVRYYLVQIVAIAGAFVSVNGAGSLGLGIAIIARGAYDGVRGRMGRREFALLRRGRR